MVKRGYDADRVTEGYGLDLNGGNGWWITSSRGVSQWVRKLAAILGLDQCPPTGSPKLIFSAMGEAGEGIDEVCSSVSTPEYSCIKDGEWVCEDKKFIRIWRHNSIADVICEINNDGDDMMEYINMCNSLQPIYQRSIRRCGGLPFHAALAELEGQGALLAAPGNTGKSTCYRRLPDYWKPMSDDEVLVVVDKQGRYQAHPFPTWSDYFWGHSENTWEVQYSVPLSGVFFLEQSEADEVVPVGEGEATILMNESTTQICRRFWRRMDVEVQRKFRRELFDNACKMAKYVPAFRLRASLHGRFWEEIEKALGW